MPHVDDRVRLSRTIAGSGVEDVCSDGGELKESEAYSPFGNASVHTTYKENTNTYKNAAHYSAFAQSSTTFSFVVV